MNSIFIRLIDIRTVQKQSIKFSQATVNLDWISHNKIKVRNFIAFQDTKFTKPLWGGRKMM